MSRHRNLKQYIDEYDDDEYYDEEDYYEEEEEVAVKPKAAAKSKAVPSAPPAAPPPPAAAPLPPQNLVVHKKTTSVNLVATQLASTSLAAAPFSKALPPASSSSSSAVAPVVVHISTKMAPTSAETFDFSTPSPDDLVIQARKRQETRTQAIKPVAALARATPTPVQKPTTTTTPPTKTKAEEKRDEEDDLAEHGKKPFFSLVVVGHVDAGKSTLMGHLLADLGVVDSKQLHKFEKESRELGKSSFKFAWVMDEHAEERERGVTIDVGVKRFETEHRCILLLDAPGHKDFVPTMITGASQADAAILVVPAVVGEFESGFSALGQTREHAWLLRNLGVSNLVVAVNKMDQVEWDQARFESIQSTLQDFLIKQVGFAPSEVVFVPVSGLTGENLHVKRHLPNWAEKLPSVTQCLDSLPGARRPVDKPMRFVVSDCYKTIHLGLVVSGKVESGVVRRGDVVQLCPLSGGVTATVKEILMHNQPVRRVKAGENCELAITSREHALQDLLEAKQQVGGVVLCDPKNPVPVASRLTCRVQTMPSLKYPLHVGSQLLLHIHSTSVPCTVVAVLGSSKLVKANQIADLELKLEHEVCVERFQDFKPLARFLLRFAGSTVAFGTVLELVN
ncbi:translation elongation factor Tu [Batrachochytrium salamandrivorans]|nr:translation elongation factor Tu [Batrachochytrium salamandrivorans]